MSFITSRRGKASFLIVLFLTAFLLRAYQPVSRPPQWFSRAATFTDAIARGKWDRTYQSRHPGVTGMLIGGIGLELYDAVKDTPAAFVFTWAMNPDATERGRGITSGVMALSFVISALIAVNTGMLARLTNWLTAIIAGGLMAFSPFYLTHSRVFHQDALVASLMLCSALLILLHAQTRQWRYMMLSGLVGGLALLTKVPSLFLFPFAGLTLLVHQALRLRTEWATHREQRGAWILREVWLGLAGPLLIWIGMAMLPFTLWPAMWVTPGFVLQNMFSGTVQHIEESHRVTRFFQGEIFSHDRPTPLYYPVTLLFKTTFVSLSLAILSLGHFTLWRRKLAISHQPSAISGQQLASTMPTYYWLFVAYVIFFVTQMSIGAKQVDRYLLPAHLMIDVLAAVGAAGLFQLIRQRVGHGRIAAVLPALLAGLVIALQASVSLPYAPNYGAHHNTLLGGNQAAVQQIEIMGQNEGVNYVGQYLRQQPNAASLLIGTAWPLDESLDEYFPGEVVKTTLVDADYFVFNLAAIQRRYDISDWEPTWEQYRNQPAQFVVRFNGTDFIWVYATDPANAHETITVEHGTTTLNALAWVWVVALVAALGWSLRLDRTAAALMPAIWQRPGRLLRLEWVLITLILLIGFALRVGYFNLSPPGVSHDEVFDWFNVQLIWQGQIMALYPVGGGREPLYLWLLAGTFKLFGTNLLALRFPSLMIGMFGIAISFDMGRRLFGRVAGLIAAAGIMTSYWALTMSRLGERTGSAPVMGLIAFYIYLRVLQKKRPVWWQYLLAGVMLAVSLYTYPAALMLPVILVAWLVVIALVRPAWLGGKWRGMALSLMVAAVLSIPLALAWTNPAQAARADVVNAPLEALLAGDPRPSLANIPAVVGMLTVQGDPGLDVNNDGLPVFPTLLLQILFYLGLLAAVVGVFRRGDPRRAGYGLALLWLVGMFIPTLVTDRALNPSRTIGWLGIVFLFPAMATTLGYELLREKGRLRWAVTMLLVAMLGFTIQLQQTAHHYYDLWPANPVVRFLYQANFKAIAADLDARPDQEPATVGGLSPYQLDPASFLLLMHEDDYARSLAFFDPQTSLLISPTAPSQEALIAVPATMTMHPTLMTHLEDWGIFQRSANEEYTLYAAEEGTSLLINGSRANVFSYGTDPLITLIHVQMIAGEGLPGQPFTLLTYWITQAPTDRELRIFVHLTDGAGNVLSQSDVLGVPAQQWRSGDVLIQAHDLFIPLETASPPFMLNIGLYDPQTNTRLLVQEPFGDHITLALP